MMKRVFALLLVAVMLFGMAPVYTSAEPTEPVIVCHEGKQVRDLEIYSADGAVLTAEGDEGSCQWQVEARPGLWVDIYGETGRSLKVTYGMVAGILRGGVANVRCELTSADGVHYSETVAVAVTHEDPDPTPAGTPVKTESKQNDDLAILAAAATDAARALATAESRGEDAVKAVNDARTDLTNAQAAKTEADAAVKEAYAALDQEKLAAARSADEEAAKAAQAVTDAKKAHETAVAAAEAAAKAIPDTAAKLEEAKAAKTAADEAAAAAKAALDAAALAAYESAVEAAKAAASAETAAKSAADEAAAKAASAEAAVAALAEGEDPTEANAAAAAAKAEAEAAASRLTEAAAAKKAAKDKVAEALAALGQEKLSAYENAAAAAKAAADTLAAAEAAAAKAPADKTAADEAVSAAAAALEAAKTAAKAAEDAAAAAYAALDQEKLAAAKQAEAAAAAAAETVKKAEDKIAAAEKALADATAAYEKALEDKKVADAALAAVSRPAMYASGARAGGVENEDLKEYYVIIWYIFGDGCAKKGEMAAPSWSVMLAAGKAHNETINSPVVAGYTPDQASVTVDLAEGDLTSNITYTVKYAPAKMTYPVYHYQQNVNDDGYTLKETTEAEGYTESETPAFDSADSLAKTYEGFRALPYVTDTIAADGTTEIVIYYDREYYLMYFDLGENGFGVEPVYARYGTTIVNPGEPTRVGYTFAHWLVDGSVTRIPNEMPAENRLYVANWWPNQEADVSIVFWGENANDEEYSYLSDVSTKIQVAPGTQITYDGTGISLCGKHVHTEACYTFTCTDNGHNHTRDGCQLSCGQEANHSHTKACYGEYAGSQYNGYLINAPWFPDQGEVYSRNNQKYIYIQGSWYYYTGTTTSGNIAPTICGKELNHRHTDACYDCGKSNYTHNHTNYTGSCYTKTCQEEDHTHTDSCYIRIPGPAANEYEFDYSETVTVNPDGSTVLNIYYDRTEFTLHFRKKNSANDDYGTIKAKWGANIEAQFDMVCDLAGYQSWSEQRDADSPWTNMIAIMPKQDKTYYSYTGSGTNQWVMTYYKETQTPNDYAEAFKVILFRSRETTVTEEEYMEMEGFTINRNKSTKTGSSTNGAKFYYDRKSFKLTFSDGFNNVKDEDVLFEAPLETYKDYKPECPENYEAASRYFDGWYLNPQCTGEEYVLSKHTMPPKDLILYAKWTPFYYDIKVYTDSSKTVKIDEQSVQHDKMAADPEYDTTSYREGYDFVGWFYMDSDGKEKAFDFANMPVKKPMEVYAKWKTNMIREVTVRYVLKGTDTEIAESVTQQAYVGDLKTFEAKTGSLLDDGYQEGYYPSFGSSSVTVDEDNSKNVIVFEYEKVKPAPYRVKYVIISDDYETPRPAFRDKNGQPEFVGNETIDEENAYVYIDENNTAGIVTAHYLPIAGYLPDDPQKELIITTDPDQNIITFYYTKSENQSLYLTRYLIGDEGGAKDSFEEFTRSETNVGQVGVEYFGTPINITGYTFSAKLTEDWKESGQNWDATENRLGGTLVKDQILTLNLYYTRNSYPYQVLYLEQGTNVQLAEPKTTDANGQLKGLYKSTVTEEAITIPGYNLVGDDEQTKEINIGTNTIIFYYERKTANLQISKMVTLDPNQEDGILELPDFAHTTPFTFTVTSEKPFHREEYSYTLTKADKSVEKKTVDVITVNGVEMLQVQLCKDESIVIEGLPLQTYRVEETHVTGFKTTINGDAVDGKDVELTEDAKTYSVPFNNAFPFYTADITLKKVVNQKDGDPAANAASYTFTVNVKPAQDTLQVARPVTVGEETVYTFGMGAYDEDHTFTVTLKAGQTLVLQDVPEGEYTITESIDSGYVITQYYHVYYNRMDNKETGGEGTGPEVKGYLSGGHDASATFTNTYRRGTLTIYKTVTQEYEEDNWSEDTFTFAVTGTTALPAGEYKNVKIGGQDAKAVVDSEGKVTVTMMDGGSPVLTLTKPENDEGNQWTSSLFISNLPAGTYQVTESGSDLGLDRYTTEVGEGDSAVPGRIAKDLEVLYGGDSELQAAASFHNEYIRSKGNLQVSKRIEIVDSNETMEGKYGLDFTFLIELNDGDLTSGYSYKLQSTNGTEQTGDDSDITGTVTENTSGRVYAFTEDGKTKIKVLLRHDENIELQGIPVGNYTVTESYTNGYNSSFQEIAGSKDKAEPVLVTENATATASCINQFPFYYGDLTITKMVDKEDDDETAPGDTFTFTVTMTETNAKAGDVFQTVIPASGNTPNGSVTLDSNLSFTVQLAAGDSIRILQLHDCEYTITESADANVMKHYDTAWTVDAGEEAEKSGTSVTVSDVLSPNDVDNVVFTNTYKRHYGKITLQKSGVSEYESDFTYIFTLNMVESAFGETFTPVTVPVTGNGSITIGELPVGTYELTEDAYATGWSWRYVPDTTHKIDGEDVAMTSDHKLRIQVDGDKQVIFKNVRSDSKWLDGADARPNIFAAKN